MERVSLRQDADLSGFRQAARRLIAARVPPEQIVWADDTAPTLFEAEEAPPAAAEASPPIALPRAAAALIETVACHRDPQRWGRLYQLIWRIVGGERALLDDEADPLVHDVRLMAQSVRRDLHKMHAFLRFRGTSDAEGEHFVAWFEPEHFILEATAGFFVDRFRGMRWTILTPDGALHWNRQTLFLGPPARREDAPAEDGVEEGWRAYYAAIFNPARTNPKAMRAEMPKKYWHALPEAALIRSLVQTAPARVQAMVEAAPQVATRAEPTAALQRMTQTVPQSLEELNRIIRAAAPMVEGGTRAVLGEGPLAPALAFVGEQPGDQEDLQGRPFVGPAGEVLNRAMAAAGIDRGRAYVTNAVKHFKFVPRGTRRLHQTPSPSEVAHYRWWLETELDLVRPRLVVALGATAVLALAGQAVPLLRNRGPYRFGPRSGFITVHPSYLLRLPDEAAKEQGFAQFTRDLRQARELAESPA